MPRSTKILNVLVPAVIFAAICFVLPFLPIYGYDSWCWSLWSTHDLKNGLQNAYNDEASPMRTNYLPVYHYVLYVYGKIAGSEQNIYSYARYLKLFPLLIEWLGLWYVCKWTDRRLPFYWLIIASTATVVYYYNSLIWGQIDGVVAAFVFISLYYGYRRQAVLSAIFLVIALNTKLQAIVFVPFWGYLYLIHAIDKKTIRSFLMPLVAIITTQVLILLPFLGSLQRVWEVVTGSVDTYPYVSVMAFNYWHLALADKVWNLQDSGVYAAGLNYRQFGLIVFFTVSALVLSPMLRHLYHKLTGKCGDSMLTRDQLWLSASAVAIAFFYFNTQMHERYSHPAFIFVAAYAVWRKDVIPFVLFSAAYFLNVEKASYLLRLNNYHTAIFHHMFIAALYGGALIYVLIRLGLSFKTRNTI